MSAACSLQQLFDQIHEAGCGNRSDVLRMFQLSRELAEARGELKIYPTLRFFADWSLHSELNRASARLLLSRLRSIVEAHWYGNPDTLPLAISEALSLGALHDELLQLLTSANLPLFLLDQPEPWTQCAS